MEKQTLSTAWIENAINISLEKSLISCDLVDVDDETNMVKDTNMGNGKDKHDESKESIDTAIDDNKGSMMNKGNDNLVMYFNLDQFESVLNNVSQSFSSAVNNDKSDGMNSYSSRFLHCLAVKSNPLPSMLSIAVQNGFGLECASISEVELAICNKVNCDPSKVVYDGPCKTVDEIKRALLAGVHLNADNFDELDRIIKVKEKYGKRSASIIGIRINPLVGAGSIETLSVSTVSSKFGIPLTKENKEKIISYFQQYHWITGLHCHVGSQGCPLSMLAEGAKIIVDLADEIDILFANSLSSSSKKTKTELNGSSQHAEYQITHIDIGGGLPTNFDSDQIDPTFSQYVAVLQEYCPSLFDENCKRIVMTEFGRAIVAKVGCTVSKIEYIKEVSQEQTKMANSFTTSNGKDELSLTTRHRIAIIHAGSDLFLRTCYCPKQFPLRVAAYRVSKDEKSNVISVDDFGDKKEDTCKYDVAGPLCFGGDKIARDIVLPKDIKAGDYIVIKDTGANCLSLFSKHCSRPSPSVYGYRNGSKELVVLRQGETIEQALSFWS